MTSVEYEGFIQRLAMTAQLVADVPISDLLNHVTHAETLGPILEPTAFIRGGSDNLRDARALLEAAAPLVTFGQQLQKRVEAAQ